MLRETNPYVVGRTSKVLIIVAIGEISSGKGVLDILPYLGCYRLAASQVALYSCICIMCVS